MLVAWSSRWCLTASRLLARRQRARRVRATGLLVNCGRRLIRPFREGLTNPSALLKQPFLGLVAASMVMRGGQHGPVLSVAETTTARSGVRSLGEAEQL